MPPADASHSFRHGRGVHRAAIAGVAALTIGLSGFFMGLRETSRSSLAQRNAWDTVPAGAAGAEAGTEHAVPVVSYSELSGETLWANHDWTNRLSNLVEPDPASMSFTQLSAEEQERVRRQRESNRQFDGAPPAAPHPVDQRSAATCLLCHGQPTVISGVMVAQMSHPRVQNCLQCHVSSAGPASTWRTSTGSPAVGNSFVGKPQPGYGSRAYVGAPPVIPHTTWMRQTCNSCHGPGGTSAFRTSHPERQSCLQCHAVNATLDQVPSLARSFPPRREELPK